MQNIIEELLVPETNKGLFYGGAFHAASQPGEIVVMNPAKGIRFTTVPDASPQDVAAAVAAARTAFPGWSGLDAFDRSKHLRAFAEVVRDNIPLLAILESTVTGRSLREMTAQMGRIPEWLEYFAGIALGLEGESNVVKGRLCHADPIRTAWPGRPAYAMEPSCIDLDKKTGSSAGGG